jgi:hypothetical protein
VGYLEEASLIQGDDSIRAGDTLMTPMGHGDAMRLASELGYVLRGVSLATQRLLEHGPAGQRPIVELVAVVR